MPEMIGKKEDLHEVDWVKEQTKSALSDLQKEVLYTKNGNEVKFDVDTSLNYLKTLKDKKTYSEVMKNNPGATVMAVQILLKNKGYNVGKIDGILRTKGQATSKTMETIKKFQRDNGLIDDGAPGPDTIKKILEVYGNGGGNNGGTEVVEDEEKVKDLTKAEFEALCEKTSLTDDEINQVVKYTNENEPENFVSLGLRSITDKQAEELGKVKKLFLDGLTSITDKQAEELGKVKKLSLDGLTSITDKQAEELGKVEHLWLDGLRSITDKQAEELSKVKKYLHLDGLLSITDKQTEELSKLENLTLKSLRSITDKQVKELSKVKKYLGLEGLTSITDKQAEELSKLKKLGLDSLTSITDNQAIYLAKVGKLWISENILTQKQKEILKNRIK